MSRTGREFTLIELLIVVAIIAILASMLLPALSEAKRMAVRMECAARLKNFGTLAAFYYSDYDDYYPWMQTTSTDYTLMDQSIAPDWRDSRVKNFAKIGYVTSDDEIRCPKAHRTYTINKTTKLISRIGYFQVGYNSALKKYTNVKFLSQQPFVSDNLWMPLDSPYPSEGTSAYRYSNHCRKARGYGANCVYGDGHVAWLHDLKKMWWGPFKGYGTTIRCLIPPYSKACYTGSDTNQPGPW